jgi:transposase InsO family protein
LDDYSRYIIAWKLCTTMKAKDVTDTLQLVAPTVMVVVADMPLGISDE